MDRRESLKSIVLGSLAGGLVLNGCKPGEEQELAEAIEQKNLIRDIKNTYGYVPQKGKPQLYWPKLFRIKKEMKEIGCK